ncbi:MAG: hypothetical protein IKX48_06760, partial [Victivallales bacterium]|nr:hypothetical protein [Victivallales bacterium]
VNTASFFQNPTVKRIQTAAAAQANRPLASSFRMMLFALARSVTNRRAAGAVCIIRDQRFVSP